MSSRIEQLIEEIETYIDGCKYQPFSNTKIVVDKEEIDSLLRELRSKTPEEIKRYQKIISNKEAILNDARQKAQGLLDEAQAHTNELISEHEIMRQAYEQANLVVSAAAKQAQDLVDKAQIEANQMKNSAVTYTDTLLAQVELVLTKALDSTNTHYEAMLTDLTNYCESVKSNRDELRPSLTVAQAAAAISQQAPAPETAVSPDTGMIPADTVADAAGAQETGDISLI